MKQILSILLGLTICAVIPGTLENTVEARDRSNCYFTNIRENLFLEQLLIREIKDLEFPYPHIVYSQAILETGWFNSPIFRENNNLFGMKLPYTRPTLAVGVNRNHAVYLSWRQSLIDYKIYSSLYTWNLTEEEYLTFLETTYAEDPMYRKKIESIINTNDLKTFFLTSTI